MGGNDYDVAEKARYSMSNNATANDRATEVLSESLDVHPEDHRLRCGAHLVNLVAKRCFTVQTLTQSSWMSAKTSSRTAVVQPTLRQL